MRALGVDYGARRIGLALSDATGLLARPWKTIMRAGNPSQVARALVAEIEALSQADEPVGVIVMGYPRRLNGSDSHQTADVEQLAAHLRRFLGVPLVLQDERLTSHEAEQVLARSESDWRKRKQQLDAMAAAIILQDYLDANPGADHAGGTPEDADE
jgi:putative Holliday junction resolvase